MTRNGAHPRQHSCRRSRRAFCRGAGAALFCCMPALRAEAALLRRGKLTLAEVAPGIFVSQGWHEEATPANLGAIANAGFVVGETSVAVIDTGGCRLWGERLREAVRDRTDLPISHVIETHMHPDHLFGSGAFLQDRPVFLGHRNLPRALASRDGFYRKRLAEELGDLAAGSVLVPPTEVVAGERAIDLGNRILRVTAHRTAHTDNDLSIYDARSATLWAGDLLFMERIPALDGSLLGWLAAMDELRRIAAQRVVPGHGPHSAAWPSALDAQGRYLTALRDQIRDVLRDGGTLRGAVARVGMEERQRWQLFDDYNPRNVTAAFAELEWE